jgi:hypothetical protein
MRLARDISAHWAIALEGIERLVDDQLRARVDQPRSDLP